MAGIRCAATEKTCLFSGPCGDRTRQPNFSMQNVVALYHVWRRVQNTFHSFVALTMFVAITTLRTV